MNICKQTDYSMAAADVLSDHFGFILTLLICLFKCGNSKDAGHEVDTCPETKAAWDQRSSSQSTSCGGQSEYHCLQDKQGRKRELCLEKSRIGEGNCPVVTEKGYLDWKPCNVSLDGCPDTQFVSNEVYQFPFCFGDNTPSQQMDPGEDSLSSGEIAAIVLAFVIVGTVAALIVYLIRRKSRGPDNPDPEMNRLLYTDREHSREEVVKDNLVREGISVLEKHDALLITGKLGTAVTRTAESIMQQFTKSDSKWKYKLCNYKDMPGEPHQYEPMTVYFVYGWFGLYNDDLCSLDCVVNTCNVLAKMLRAKCIKNKFIIGLRSEFRSRYGKDLEQFKDALFQYSMSLDSEDTLRDEGYLAHFEKHIKDPCNNLRCQCKGLKIEMLMGKESEIGIPLKLAILANDHKLIAKFMESKKFKNTLKKHFRSLKEEDEELYQCIMYVCFKGELKRSEDIDRSLVENVRFVITKETTEKKMEALEEYIRIRKSDKRNNIPPESATYIFWHPFIYICAFQALFESNPDEVMRYCNIDAILQLVRPEWENSEKYFTVIASEEKVQLFLKRLESNETEARYALSHPLLGKPPSKTP